MPRKRPDFLAAWIIAWASLTVAAVGLGTTTSRPALSASTVGAQWRWSGVLTWTASSLTWASSSPVIGEAAGGGHAGEVGEPVAVLLVRVGNGADIQQVRVMAVEVEVLVDLAHDGAGANDA